MVMACTAPGHRAGRLNVLANVVRKPLRQIFSEFAGVGPEGEGKEYFGTGDVKYHLGTSYDRPTTSGKRVHLSLLANPSHLEVLPSFPRSPDLHSFLLSHSIAALLKQSCCQERCQRCPVPVQHAMLRSQEAS